MNPSGTVVRLGIVCMAIAASPAIAQERIPQWNCNVGAGECVGRMTMTVRKAFWDDAVGSFALSSFANGELLFEDFSSTDTKKVLCLPKLDCGVFYDAKDRAEAERIRRHFEQSAGRVEFAVMVGMFGAFPEGESAMSPTWQTRKAMIEGSPMEVSAKRSGKGRFLFKIQSREWDVEGEWDMGKPAAWPDDKPLDGWTIWGTLPAPPLGEVRKAMR